MRSMNVFSLGGELLKVTHDPAVGQVAFYDTRYPHTDHGQFISRYNTSAFLPPSRAEHYGLALNGVEREWTISNTTYRAVVGWLNRSGS